MWGILGDLVNLENLNPKRFVDTELFGGKI
jgi:hypothetical protein